MPFAGDTVTSLRRNDSNVYYSTKYLKSTMINMVMDKFGASESLPKNSGDSVTYREFVPNSIITTVTPLVEGTPPSPLTTSMREVRAQLSELGNYLRFSNRLMEVFEDGGQFLSKQEEWIGRYRAEEKDRFLFFVLRAGSQVQYAGTAVARSSVNAPISVGLLHKAERILAYGTNGRPSNPITSIMAASQNFGSVGIEPSFVAVVHPDLVYDIRQLPGFNSVENYGTQGAALQGEIGKCGKFRFVVTTHATAWADSGGAVASTGMKSTTGTSADVYPVLLFAQDAYFYLKIPIADDMALIYKPFGSAGVADPINQAATLGYRHWFAGLRTFEYRMLRLEVAATNSPS